MIWRCSVVKWLSTLKKYQYVSAAPPTDGVQKIPIFTTRGTCYLNCQSCLIFSTPLFMSCWARRVRAGFKMPCPGSAQLARLVVSVSPLAAVTLWYVLDYDWSKGGVEKPKCNAWHLKNNYSCNKGKSDPLSARSVWRIHNEMNEVRSEIII